jgi:hypothetical protein
MRLLIAITSMLIIFWSLPSISQADLPLDKLALYFSFEEGKGDTVTDLSPNGNNGKFQGKSGGGVKWVNNGKYGSAVEFHGVDNIILVKTSKSLEIETEVTMSVWINWNDAPGDGWLGILANGHQDGPWENYSLFVNRGGRYIYFCICLGAVGNVTTQNSGNNTTEPGKWQHIVASYDGTARIYVDGEKKFEQKYGQKLCTPRLDLEIGHREASTHFYNGLIDEIAIFEAAFTDAQVKEASEWIQPMLAVYPKGKLTTTWGNLKNDYYLVR